MLKSTKIVPYYFNRHWFMHKIWLNRMLCTSIMDRFYKCKTGIPVRSPPKWKLSRLLLFQAHRTDDSKIPSEWYRRGGLSGCMRECCGGGDAGSMPGNPVTPGACNLASTWPSPRFYGVITTKTPVLKGVVVSERRAYELWLGCCASRLFEKLKMRKRILMRLCWERSSLGVAFCFN